MQLQTFKNITAVLKIVGDKPEVAPAVKRDIEEATTFFGNVISDVEKELAKKEERAADKKAGRLLVYPLRIEI